MCSDTGESAVNISVNSNKEGSSENESNEATDTRNTVLIPVQTDIIVKVINTTDTCKADSSEDEHIEVPDTGKSAVNISVNSEKEDSSKDGSNEATDTGNTVINPVQSDKIVKVINTTDSDKSDSSEEEINEDSDTGKSAVNISANSRK